MFKELDIDKYPINKGESWWISHPNDSRSSFELPEEAYVLCLVGFENFKVGIVYRVTGHDKGWLVVHSKEDGLRIPEYVFARHFDYKSFYFQEISLPVYNPNKSGPIPNWLRYEDCPDPNIIYSPVTIPLRELHEVTCKSGPYSDLIEGMKKN